MRLITHIRPARTRKRLEDLDDSYRQTFWMRRAYSLHKEILGLMALETRGGQMLDPWIIEEIKRREQKSRIEQPVIQIPVVGPEPRDPKNDEEKKEPPRGVEIIDFGVGSSGYGW